MNARKTKVIVSAAGLFCLAWVAVKMFMPAPLTAQTVESGNQTAAACAKFHNLTWYRQVKLGTAAFINPEVLERTTIAYKYDLSSLLDSQNKKQIFTAIRKGKLVPATNLPKEGLALLPMFVLINFGEVVPTLGRSPESIKAVRDYQVALGVDLALLSAKTAELASLYANASTIATDATITSLRTEMDKITRRTQALMLKVSGGKRFEGVLRAMAAENDSNSAVMISSKSSVYGVKPKGKIVSWDRPDIGKPLPANISFLSDFDIRCAKTIQTLKNRILSARTGLPAKTSE